MRRREETNVAPQHESVRELDERLFRAHFENLPGPAFIWKRDGGGFRLIAHNRAGAEIGGSDVQSLLGIRLQDLYADRPHIVAEITECAQSRTVVRREADHRFVSGVTRRMATTYVPLSSDIVVVHAEDVTERRKMERELARTAERLGALVAANPDVVFRMDATATFLDLHVPDAVRFPWPPQALIGRTVGHYFGEEAHRQQVAYNREAIRTGEVQVFQYKLPDGDRMLTLESRVARAGNNEVVVTVRDVSEHADLENKITVLEERERNRIGHEIHDGLAQMLAGARLSLEHLERRLADAGSPLVDDAARAVEIINSTIGYARELVRGMSPIPVGTTLSRALELLAKHSERYLGVACRLKWSGEALDIDEATTAHLYRIAQEAITNAVKHGKATSIELGYEAADQRVALTIADDGVGIPEDGGDPEGLGLKIMRYRARSIGGGITIEPRAERGTRVICHFTLPAALG